MAASKTSIINLAFIEVGLDTVASVEDSSTEKARVATLVYEEELEALLEEHPWNFAKDRVTLSREVSTPNHGYQYMYALPADIVRLVDVNLETIPYTVENGKILTNENKTVEIIYCKIVSTVSKMPSAFRKALSYRIATRLAPKFTTERENIKKTVESLADYWVRNAKVIDSQNSGRPEPKRPMNFINARI